MSHYIVPEEKAEYFFKKGICRKTPSGTENIAPEAVDGFGLYRDDTTHIICSDKSNNIIYVRPGKEPVTISGGREGIKPYDFTVTLSGEYLSLFYKTDYENEILLFHCIIGSSSKPYPATSLLPSHPYYSVSGGNLFFTGKDGGIYRCDISKGKATEPQRICDDGIMPCAAEIDGKCCLTYVSGGKIFFNGSEIATDKNAEMPVVFSKNQQIFVQWKSGNFVKYSKSADGEEWSEPSMYIGSGKMPSPLFIADRNESYICYGYGGKALCASNENNAKTIYDELREIKKQLANVKSELKKINSMNYFDLNGKK